MKTKMLKKIISIACALTMATSCAAMSVGAVPPGDYGFDIDDDQLSVSLVQDLADNIASAQVEKSEKLVTIQNRVRELADRVSSTEQWSQNNIDDLARDIKAVFDDIVDMFPGIENVNGVNEFLDEINSLIDEGLRSRDLSVVGVSAGDLEIKLRRVENVVAEFVSCSREVVAEWSQIAEMMELVKGQEGEKKTKKGFTPDPTPDPGYSKTPDETPKTNRGGYDDEMLAVELQLNEFGESITDHSSYNDAKETAANYQRAIANSFGSDLSPNLGDSRSNNNLPNECQKSNLKEDYLSKKGIEKQENRSTHNLNNSQTNHRLPDVAGTPNPNNLDNNQYERELVNRVADGSGFNLLD